MDPNLFHLFSKVSDAEKADDHRLLREAAGKFHQARRHWLTPCGTTRLEGMLSPRAFLR